MKKELAQKFIERIKITGVKGVRRDEYALEFFLGAAQALQLDNSKTDLTKAAWFVSIRGYSAVEEMANL